ncbi:adenosylhomocysteinase, partial [Striga asiatica]
MVVRQTVLACNLVLEFLQIFLSFLQEPRFNIPHGHCAVSYPVGIYRVVELHLLKSLLHFVEGPTGRQPYIVDDHHQVERKSVVGVVSIPHFDSAFSLIFERAYAFRREAYTLLSFKASGNFLKYCSALETPCTFAMRSRCMVVSLVVTLNLSDLPKFPSSPASAPLPSSFPANFSPPDKGLGFQFLDPSSAKAAAFFRQERASGILIFAMWSSESISQLIELCFPPFSIICSKKVLAFSESPFPTYELKSRFPSRGSEPWDPREESHIFGILLPTNSDTNDSIFSWSLRVIITLKGRAWLDSAFSLIFEREYAFRRESYTLVSFKPSVLFGARDAVSFCDEVEVYGRVTARYSEPLWP